MPRSDWQRIQELFLQACELDEPERVVFLDAACGDDEEVRRLLDGMLEQDADPPTILDRNQGELAASMFDTDDETPERIGPYIINGLIGRGGMGVVLLAERPDLPRKVALKLVRDRWLGSDGVQRFKREQAVLARLEHPNIGRLFDVATADDGTPYLTMEYVDGRPITEFCARSRCTIPQKLNLMVDVCEAVQYAHRNLVVHRDLKPSNILVNRDGRVKLLDFGIAKLLESDEVDPAATLTSNRLMTPQYASPEQLAGEPVTTASDVYSLGVVMYELLTGRRPYALEGKSATEALRILTEEEPRRPSTTAEDEGQKRGLKGDLDNILLKALQRDPAARYSSVESMLADIRRHLGGFPVEAREATIPYRARKFVLRHKVGVGIGAGVLILLVAFGAAITMQRSATARERIRAEQEAARAERTSEFLMGLFEASDPAQALGDSVSAGQLLERGIEQADALANQPFLQAETYGVIGRVYRSLGQNDRAIRLLERAIEVHRSNPEHLDQDLASTLRNLSEVYASSRRNDDAIRAADEALAIGRRISRPPSVEIARGLNSLGVALMAAGRFGEADSLFQLAYEQMRVVREEDDKESIAVLANRLAALQELGHHEVAEGIARTVLAWRREHLPPNHPGMAEVVDFLAVILRNLARYDEAEPLYEEALAIKTRVYGSSHPSTAASILNLAIFYGIQGQYKRAEPVFERAVESYVTVYGAESPRTAHTLTMYAVLLARMGRFDEATALSRRAFVIQREKLGPSHPNTISTEMNLGIALCNRREYDEGLPVVRRAVASYKEAFGADNPRYGHALMTLGLYEALAGEHAGGIANARASTEIFTASLGPDDQRTALSFGMLGRALTAAGDHAAADSVLRDAFRRYTAHVDRDDPSAVAMADAMGQTKTALGQFAEADSLLRFAYDVRIGRLGPDHAWTKETAQHIRDLYREWGREAPPDLTDER